MRRLPPLSALRVFEAVARHCSMSRAAEELRVTHGAVSHRMQALEAELGITLLRRHPRSVEPTEQGARLAASLGEAFELISSAVSEVRAGSVVLSCSTSLAMRWLMPRMADLQRDHPKLDLQLSLHSGPIRFGRDEIDIALRNNVVSAPPDAIVRTLIKEAIGPVCSPEYASAQLIREPGDLGRSKLLGTKTRIDAWDDWYENNSVGRPQGSPELYDHYSMLLEACVCSLGVAIAPKILVAVDIAAGRLVAPFGFSAGRRSLELWIAQHSRHSTSVRTVADWLTKQINVEFPSG